MKIRRELWLDIQMGLMDGLAKRWRELTVSVHKRQWH